MDSDAPIVDVDTALPGLSDLPGDNKDKRSLTKKGWIRYKMYLIIMSK